MHWVDNYYFPDALARVKVIPIGGRAEGGGERIVE
jgi:hypothetical protein